MSIILGLLSLIILLPLAGLIVFLIVLYIKLGLRGIKALEIYINKNF